MEQPFVIAEVSRPPQPKESGVKSKATNTTVTSCIPINDVSTGSLDSKLDIDLLIKSNGTHKSNNSKDNDDKAFVDDRLHPIFKEEFEHLYERVKTLNRAVVTLKESYQDHLRSLVKLGKPQKATNSMASVEEKSQQSTNMLTNISDLKTNVAETDKLQGKDRRTKKDTDINTRYRLDTHKSELSQEEVIVDSRFDMAHFLDPIMRDNTFRDLFNEVNTLNESLSKLKSFYDSDGDFLLEEYGNSDYRISRSTFDTVRQKVSLPTTSLD